MTTAHTRPRLAINGFGRIGRACARALFERGLDTQFELVAINELASLESIAYLTRYDSTHGRFPCNVTIDGDCLLLGAQRVQIINQAEAATLPWGSLAVDCVLECSGTATSRSLAEHHITAGADKVLISNPADSAVDATVVMGVNHTALRPEHRIVSAASCTTNATVPLIALMQRTFGVEYGLITTIHSAMNDQPLLDAYHSHDLRKTRAALQSIIPIDTGLARGIERLLPDLAGRFQAQALRVPTQNVSAMDITLLLQRPAEPDQIHAAIAAFEREQPQWLGLCYEPLASCDFNHDARSGVVDAAQTRVAGRMAKLLVWFDNEWAFANRMLDLLLQMYNKQ